MNAGGGRINKYSEKHQGVSAGMFDVQHEMWRRNPSFTPPHSVHSSQLPSHGAHDPASHGPASRSEADLRATPVTALGVVPDLRVSLHAEPLGQRPVLPHLLRKVHLCLEGLHGTHFFLTSCYCCGTQTWK